MPRSPRAARRDEAAADRLLRRGAGRGSGVGTAVAVVLGGAPLILTPLCVAGGTAVAVVGRHSPLLVGLGIITAVAALAAVPRPPRLHPGAAVVDRARAPAFWKLLDDVAEAVGTSPPDLVALDLEPNASIGNVGVRSRTVLTVGTPLWTILDGQQRIGLLAHELGHLAHGDPRRGRVVALGMQTLVRWWVSLVPTPTTRADGPLRWIENALLAGARQLVRLWLAAIDHLQTPAVRRAELRSDRVAASVAGWAGYTGLLDRLRYGPRLGHAIDLAVARRDGVEFHASIVDSIRTLPPQEDERLRRLAARQPYDRRRSHPPARLRLRAVDDLRDEGGVVVPDSVRWGAIDAELDPLMAGLAQQARDDHDARKDRFTGVRRPLGRRPASPRATPADRGISADAHP